MVVKFGNRQSNRHYRVYTKKNILRFEFELKDKDKLNYYHNLLQQSHLEELEKNLSYQFFKYSFQIFSNAQQPEHIDWLFHRVRPYQHRNSLSLQHTNIYSHYTRQCDFKQLQQKKDFIILLQLFMFVRSLKFEEKTLVSKYRQYKFPLRDFLKYIHPGRSIHHFQTIKVKEFFDTLRQNIVLEWFTDESYRMLVTIPEAKVYKSKNKKNSWVVEVLIAKELFEYLCPFLYRDSFKEDLKKYQFAVLFEIIKVFSSNTTRKEFNIKQFLKSYGSNINGRQKKQIKDSFIRYLKEFQQEGKLQHQVVFPLLNTTSNPKSTCHISQLTSQRLYEPFVVFEIVNVNFK